MLIEQQRTLRRMAAGGGGVERFEGFSDEAIQFLLELQAEQSRVWFKAHQADFERWCRRPLELLVGELRERLVDLYPGLADAEPHLFRIQRDTRFARDKTPYKTNLAANLPVRAARDGEDGHAIPGVFLSFGLDGEFVGTGVWHLSADALSRYRHGLADAKRGPAIKAIVDGLVAEGWSLASMEQLKRVPAPYPQDHVCADLLKRKGLAVSLQPGENVSASPALVDWAEARLRATAPLLRWLDNTLAQG